MKLNTASAYQHMQELVGRIRGEASTYLKCTIHPSQLLPGDMIAETGQVVTNVFDHVFDTKDEVSLDHDAYLVQFSQVSGLAVVRGNVEIFRPTS